MSRYIDKSTGSLHLQGVGRVPAILATEVKAGMLLSWNYSPSGYKVLAVRRVSARFIEITEANRETGEVHRRKVRDDRMIAARWPSERERARDRARSRRQRDPGTRHVRIENGLRVVDIAENSGDWIAVYSVNGSAVRSRTFKTQAGARRWAQTQVARGTKRDSRRAAPKSKKRATARRRSFW